MKKLLTLLLFILFIVNKNAIGNTKITNLNKEIINGFKAYLIDCKTPWIATEIPINTNPILEILNAIVQTLIIFFVVPPASPNKLASG